MPSCRTNNLFQGSSHLTDGDIVSSENHVSLDMKTTICLGLQSEMEELYVFSSDRISTPGP